MTSEEMQKALGFAFEQSVCDLKGDVLHDVTDLWTCQEFAAAFNVPQTFENKTGAVVIRLGNGEVWLVEASKLTF